MLLADKKNHDQTKVIITTVPHIGSLSLTPIMIFFDYTSFLMAYQAEDKSFCSKPYHNLSFHISFKIFPVIMLMIAVIWLYDILSVSGNFASLASAHAPHDNGALHASTTLMSSASFKRHVMLRGQSVGLLLLC
ncbi:hypothetical protein NPIL_93851 [Nephila pilipes]|uniref:Uncharacterized protein n=1 Tax=Nephila pilipes TaxID=299642 RepID=A0A8X6TPC2_NEPPI|nr:hypothetical protein NPIL_93851 [Nephila pilipes]